MATALVPTFDHVVLTLHPVISHRHNVNWLYAPSIINPSIPNDYVLYFTGDGIEQRQGENGHGNYPEGDG